MAQCKPLVEKITTRISTWVARTLSYAGSVVDSISSLWTTAQLFLQKVMKLIEVACRSYLWSGSTSITSRALVAWDKICIPKSAGGLNLINFKLWNQAALCKHLWALSQKKGQVVDCLGS